MDAPTAAQESLPLSSDALLAQLDAWGLSYVLHQHVPLRTVEESKAVEGDLLVPGETALRLKNLYLRDRKKRNYLVSLQQDREIDLKALGAQLGVGGLSFGSEERLMEHLGIRPGAVTPLAMINGAPKGVRFTTPLPPCSNGRCGPSIMIPRFTSAMQVWSATPRVWTR